MTEHNPAPSPSGHPLLSGLLRANRYSPDIHFANILAARVAVRARGHRGSCSRRRSRSRASPVWVTARRSTRSSSRCSASTGGSSMSASPCARSCWRTTRMTRCAPGRATRPVAPPMLTPTRGLRCCAGGVVPQVPRPHHGQLGRRHRLRGGGRRRGPAG
eukprot:scaffold6576_cov65-Phaeocystis_antarctica.AAC.2